MIHAVVTVTEPKIWVEVPPALLGKQVDVVVTERKSDPPSNTPAPGMTEFAGALKLSPEEQQRFAEFTDEGRGDRDYD